MSDTDLILAATLVLFQPEALGCAIRVDGAVYVGPECEKLTPEYKGQTEQLFVLS